MVFDRAEKYAPYIIIPLMTWLLVMWTAPRAGVPAYAGPGSEAELPPPTGWRGAGGKTNANSDFAFDDDVEEGKAAVVAPPAPPPAPCPPPAPAPAAVSTGLTFADASIDKRVKEAVDCLRQHGTYKDGCWWKIRREVTFAVLEYLASLPTDQLDEFSFINSGKTEVSGGYSGWASMDLLVPVYECNTNQMKKLGGAGDLGKLFCGDVNHLISSITQTRQQLKQATNDPNPHADCIIYSLGSNGQFGFEEEVKKTVNDRCEIHTFDCTGVWSNPSTTFHNWCLGIPPAGTAEHDKPRFKTLWQITQELNHSYVSLLKMDIEGAEYTVFRSMFTPENSHLLPVAIFVEMHTHLIANLDSFLPEDYVKHQNWAKPLWELVKTLDEYGYVIIAKERNEWGPDHSKCCAEYLFLRIKQVQGLDLKKVSGFGRKWRSGRKGVTEDEDQDPKFRMGFEDRYPGRTE